MEVVEDLSKTCSGVAMGGEARLERGMSGCEEVDVRGENVPVSQH